MARRQSTDSPSLNSSTFFGTGPGLHVTGSPIVIPASSSSEVALRNRLTTSDRMHPWHFFYASPHVHHQAFLAKITGSYPVQSRNADRESGQDKLKKDNYCWTWNLNLGADESSIHFRYGMIEYQESPESKWAERDALIRYLNHGCLGSLAGWELGRAMSLQLLVTFGKWIAFVLNRFSEAV